MTRTPAVGFTGHESISASVLSVEPSLTAISLELLGG